MIFDPKEFDKALDIPLTNVSIDKNNWFSGLFKDKPISVTCFPYAQHYLSDNPGHNSNIGNEEELINAFKSTNFDEIKPLSTKGLQNIFVLNGILLGVSIVINLIFAYIFFF